MTTATRAAGEADEAAPRRCPLCGAAEASGLPNYSREPWRLVACAGCGLVYLANPPATAALAQEYAWEKTFDAEKERRLREAPLTYRLDYATRWRLRLFRPNEMRLFRRLFGESGAVLDVGCGSGGRIKPPFTPFGIEVSRELARRADATMRGRGGFCVCAPAIAALDRFADGQFAGIVMRSYLEHEPQPVEVLAAAAKKLAPNVSVYVKVPNYGALNRRVMGRNWCGFRHPDHVNYFTLATLKRTAAAAGLRLHLLNRLNLPLDDNIHARLARAA